MLSHFFREEDELSLRISQREVREVEDNGGNEERIGWSFSQFLDKKSPFEMNLFGLFIGFQKKVLSLLLMMI